MRKGVTLVELLIATGVIIVIGIFSFSSLANRPAKADLDATVIKAVAMLRDAQNRSINQNGNVQWGVHFDNNSTSSPFFVMFSGASYSTSTSINRVQLSRNVQFATTTLPAASSTNIIFSKITGAPSIPATTTIGFEWRLGSVLKASSSATVTVGGLIY